MDLTLLQDIAIIFALSIFVNFIFTKIRLPTIIGYLLTGIIAGPYMLSVIHELEQIERIAEIGIVLLMFSIGIEFSLNHLLKIRRTVFLGGFLQLFLTGFALMYIASLFDLDWKASLFFGFLAAVTSTTVSMKILQERSEVTSNFGRSVLGISLFQDIFMITMVLFIPMLGGHYVDIAHELFTLSIKAVTIVLIVFIGNRWLMPRVLHLIALTKNKELFLMSILLICLSIALTTAGLGLSLAFGAFMAGLMISESEYSHDAFGNIIPFKDTFASFFFVSIGMLLDLDFLMDNFVLVIGTTLIVIVVKFILAAGAAFVLGHTLIGIVMVGITLAQIGEVSFVLARVGLDYQVITVEQYQLFLTTAVITMSVSPFLVQIGKPFANALLKLPMPKFLVQGIFPLQQIDPPSLKNHLVLIGKDSRSRNLSLMAKYMKLPYIAIVFDAAEVPKRSKRGETVIYGDAMNEPILLKAHVDTAEVVVVSIGDLITSMGVIEKIRHINKHAYLLVRTKHVDDIEELYKLGADQVIPEEFETAIELFQRVLKKYLLPRRQIDNSIAHIRDDNYGIFREEDENLKYSILKDIPNIEITAFKVSEHSYLVGKSPASLLLRTRYGVTLLAIKRQDLIIDNPESHIEIHSGDILYLLGKPEKMSDAIELFSKESA